MVGLSLVAAFARGAQAPADPARAPGAAWRPAAAAQELEKPRSIDIHERTPGGDTVTFVSSGTPPGMSFRTGYFGMPVVIAPYDGAEGTLRLIARGEVHVFRPSKRGFRLVRRSELPAAPPEKGLDDLLATPPSGPWTQDALLQHYFHSNTDIGYQLDELGRVYWLGRREVYVHEPAGWRSVYTFDEAFLARKRSHRSFTGVVVMPGHRLALFGGKDALIRIVDLSDRERPATTVNEVGYDALGCDASSYPSGAAPQFCLPNNKMYVYLGRTGRFFRMDLDTYSLKSLGVPWVNRAFEGPHARIKWEGTFQGQPTEPILPESIAFALDWSGSVHAAALMYNLHKATLHVFDLDAELSKVTSEIKLGDDLPDPLQFQDEQGAWVPIKGAKVVPEGDGGGVPAT